MSLNASPDISLLRSYRSQTSSNGRIAISDEGMRLVPVPVRWGDCWALGSIPGRLTGDAALTNVEYSAAGEFGNTQSLACYVTEFASAQTARFQTRFRGGAFGVLFDPSWQYSVSANVHYYRGFSVLIDGAAYKVPRQSFDPATGRVWQQSSRTHGVVVAVDLAPHQEHVAEIIIPEHISLRNHHLIHGFLLQEAAGYRAPRRMSLASLPAVVPNAATGYIRSAPTQLVGSSTDQARQMTHINQVIYHNTAGSAAVVTITYNSTTMMEVYLAAAGADGATKVVDFGCAQFAMTDAVKDFKHQASAAGVNYTVIGETP